MLKMPIMGCCEVGRWYRLLLDVLECGEGGGVRRRPSAVVEAAGQRLLGMRVAKDSGPDERKQLGVRWVVAEMGWSGRWSTGEGGDEVRIFGVTWRGAMTLAAGPLEREG